MIAYGTRFHDNYAFFMREFGLFVRGPGYAPLTSSLETPPIVEMADTNTSMQTLAYIIAYTTFGLGLSTVALRVYCRQFLLNAWGWDDYIALFVGVSTL